MSPLSASSALEIQLCVTTPTFFKMRALGIQTQTLSLQVKHFTEPAPQSSSYVCVPLHMTTATV